MRRNSAHQRRMQTGAGAGGSCMGGSHVKRTRRLVALLAFKAPAESSYPLALLVWGGSIGVVLWYLFVIGYILRAALDTGMFTGVAIALAYVAGSSALLSSLFTAGA